MVPLVVVNGASSFLNGAFTFVNGAFIFVNGAVIFVNGALSFVNGALFIQRSGDYIRLPNRERLVKSKFQNGRLCGRSSQPCVGGN